MTHSYASQYPSGVEVDAGIKSFFEDFYRISDTPDAHDEYADSFDEGAVLIIGSRRAEGRDQILALRKSMWLTIASRLHTPLKIFPFGPRSSEVMLFGTVAYVFKDGRRAEVEWAARANMVRDGERWKMEYYQVYLDSAAAQAAK